MEDIVLRRLDSADLEKYKSVRLEALSGNDAKAFGATRESFLKKSEENIKADLENPERFYIGLMLGDELCSIGGAKKVGEEEWMLIGMYTLPEFRGKGFSEKIARGILDELVKNGSKKAILMVNMEQEAAIKLYKKLGFKTVKIEEKQKMGDGKIYDEFLMEKYL